MEWMIDLLGRVADDVLMTFRTVWPFLAVAVLVAGAVPVYVGLDRMSRLLRRKSSVATLGAVALATLTPFCSCGTTAVLLGMIASSSPWAPLVAFMVSSPLTSPSELIFSAGLFGWSFAVLFFVGTIVLGLLAGWVANVLDRSGWLEGQARVQAPAISDTTPSRTSAQGCPIEPMSDETTRQGPHPARVATIAAPRSAVVVSLPRLAQRLRLGDYGRELMRTGRRLFIFFFAYTTIGYLVIEAIPTTWLTEYLGGDSALAVPLAAIIGIPAYINTEGSLPLVAAMVDGGMGPGPALAFIVTGAGTSVGAISGLFVIARTRVVTLVVTMLFAGALILGWTGQLML